VKAAKTRGALEQQWVVTATPLTFHFGMVVGKPQFT